MEVRNETLMRRLAGRRICAKCGTVYNVHTLPEGVNTCAKDGTELYQRPDDKEEVIGKRLAVYDQQTKPLIEHYTKLGLLRAVAGEGELEEVSERMEAAAMAKPVPASKVKLTKARAKTVATKTAKAPAKKQAPAKKPAAKKKPVVKAAKGKAAKSKAVKAKSAKVKTSKAKTAKKTSTRKAPKKAARRAKPRAKK
jgi:adenylate kinase